MKSPPALVQLGSKNRSSAIPLFGLAIVIAAVAVSAWHLSDGRKTMASESKTNAATATPATPPQPATFTSNPAGTAGLQPNQDHPHADTTSTTTRRETDRGADPRKVRLEDSKFGPILARLPEDTGTKLYGPLDDAAYAQLMNRLAYSLEVAATNLAKAEAEHDGTDRTLGWVLKDRYTYNKYASMLACCESGLYWTVDPHGGGAMNRRLNELAGNSCWLIHHKVVRSHGRHVSVLIYVPKDLFPAIERNDTETMAHAMRTDR